MSILTMAFEIVYHLMCRENDMERGRKSTLSKILQIFQCNQQDQILFFMTLTTASTGTCNEVELTSIGEFSMFLYSEAP